MSIAHVARVFARVYVTGGRELLESSAKRRTQRGGTMVVSLVFRSRPADARPPFDVDLLPPDNRAALRLLSRSGIAASRHLGQLVYASERIAQRKLRRLWEAGVLERAAAPEGAGTPTYVYRLAPVVLRWVRGSAPPRPRPHVRHDLHTLDVVCALAREHEGLQPVSLWLTESMARGLPTPGVRPDALLAIQLAAGSCVLCVEVDEATEHAHLIRRKLAAYRQPLFDRPGWRLLVVVPDAARVEWLRRVAASASCPARSFVAVLPELRREGFAASVMPLIGRTNPIPLESLSSDAVPRSSQASVGSVPWRGLLAAGGAEDTVGLLRP